MLLVIDVQNDFCPGGALEVASGDEVVPLCNALVERFRHVVFSQDWHPAEHMSFAPNNAGAAPYEVVQAAYGEQTLWPTHCVQGGAGAAFHAGLRVPEGAYVVRKGYNPHVDSYSAFLENDKCSQTGLREHLESLGGVRRAVVVGLAYDFCVVFSAIDVLRHAGLRECVILKEATRAVGLPGSVEAADKACEESGIQRI